MPLDPKRTVAELRELQELTGDAPFVGVEFKSAGEYAKG